MIKPSHLTVFNQPSSTAWLIKNCEMVFVIVVGHTMMVSLTFDHRVVDGEIGAKYLMAFKGNLEGY